MYMLCFSALFFTFILFYLFFFSTLFSISAEVKHNRFVDEI